MSRAPLAEHQQVIEYLKLVGERFGNVRAYHIDQTVIGDVFVENVRRVGLRNVKGVELWVGEAFDYPD